MRAGRKQMTLQWIEWDSQYGSWCARLVDPSGVMIMSNTCLGEMLAGVTAGVAGRVWGVTPYEKRSMGAFIGDESMQLVRDAFDRATEYSNANFGSSVRVEVDGNQLCIVPPVGRLLWFQ